MAKKARRSVGPKGGRTAAEPASTTTYLRAALRGLPEMTWLVSRKELKRLVAELKVLADSDDDWDVDHPSRFLSFQTLSGSTVCLNVGLLMYGQAVKEPPPGDQTPPQDKARFWFEGRAEPWTVGAAEPELLDIQGGIEGAVSTEDCLTWRDETGRPAFVLVGEIALVEYPGDWGSLAGYPQEEDVITF